MSTAVLCRNGHLRTPANLGRERADGSRRCLACHRSQSRDWQRRRRAARLRVEVSVAFSGGGGLWAPAELRPFALITWHGRDMRAAFRYFATELDARAAAPAHAVYTVVDRSRPVVPLPNIDELCRRSRPTAIWPPVSEYGRPVIR